MAFKEVMKTHIKTLETYVPVVERVHGDHHPEFHEVRKLFDSIRSKIVEAGADGAELSDEFARLRQITANYTVPDDVCESYEAVYNMLAEADRAYKGNANGSHT